MPESWTFVLVAIVALASIIYGVSKTALPGGGILAGTLLAAALGPAAASGFALPLLLVGDVIALSRYRRGANWRIILGGMIGAAALFALLDRATLSRILGVLILASVLLEVRRRRLGEHAADSSTPLSRQVAVGFYGTLAGMTTMTANAGGAAMTLYLLKIRVPMLAFLGTSSWFWAIVNITKVPFALGLGTITAESLRADLWFLPFLLAGAGLGVWLYPRMSQKFFSAAVLGLSGVAAVWLIVHG